MRTHGNGGSRRACECFHDCYGKGRVVTMQLMAIPLTWCVLGAVSTDSNDPFLPLFCSTIVLSSLYRRPCGSPPERTSVAPETGFARNRGPTLQLPQSSPHDALRFLASAQQIFLLFPSSGFLSVKAYACVLKYRNYVLNLSTNMPATSRTSFMQHLPFEAEWHLNLTLTKLFQAALTEAIRK